MELLFQLPETSNERLQLITKIFDNYPGAAENLRLLEGCQHDEDVTFDQEAVEVGYDSASLNQRSRHAKSFSAILYKPRFCSGVFADLVKVRVGAKQEIFEVHRQLLVKIPYLSGLLCGSFVEGGSSQADLPEDIQLYINVR